MGDRREGRETYPFQPAHVLWRFVSTNSFDDRKTLSFSIITPRLNTSVNGRIEPSTPLRLASSFVPSLLPRSLTTILRTQYQTPLKLDTPTAKPATHLHLCFLRWGHHHYHGPLFAHRSMWDRNLIDTIIALSVSLRSRSPSHSPWMQKTKLWTLSPHYRAWIVPMAMRTCPGIAPSNQGIHLERTRFPPSWATIPDHLHYSWC